MVNGGLDRGSAAAGFVPDIGAGQAEWLLEPGLLDYARGVTAMEDRVEAIARGKSRELVWLVEHPPLITAGTSALSGDLVSTRFPVYATGRGGQFTYLGPGQRVAYVMLDLKRRKADLRAFVGALEDWLIAALAALGVAGERREERVGVWVRRPDKGPGHEDKIAAIGIRVRRWVTYHGVSLNVSPELGHFQAIVPCGVSDPRYGVTSLSDLGLPAGMAEADRALRAAFEARFGATKAHK